MSIYQIFVYTYRQTISDRAEENSLVPIADQAFNWNKKPINILIGLAEPYPKLSKRILNVFSVVLDKFQQA
jgi:hypothetical protein